MHKWSVWRRYSEFEELERALRKQLGWQMERVGEFPAKNSFSFNKLGPEFVEARREELDAWWQRLMRVDKVGARVSPRARLPSAQSAPRARAAPRENPLGRTS